MGRKQKPRRIKPIPKPAQATAATPSGESGSSQSTKAKRGKKKTESSGLFTKSRMLALVPAVFAFLLYANTFNNGFTIDDDLVHTLNPYVQNGEYGEILSKNMIWGATQNNDGLFRPLSQLMFAWEVQQFGPGPYAGHVVNVLLMAICGWLVFLLVTLMLPNGPPWLPLVTALVFVAHPIHTEAVANIKGRDEVLALLNFLASAWFFLKYYDTKKIPMLLGGLAFFFLALLSKESALTFIVIFPLLLLVFRNASVKNAAIPTIPFAVLLGLWAMWRSKVIEGVGKPIDEGVTGLLNNSLFGAQSYIEQFATACWLQMMYLGKMIFPHPLVHDHSFNQVPVMGLSDPKAILGLLVMLGMAAAIILLWKKEKVLVFGLVFYFVGLAVVSNVVILIGSTFAERFLFAPSLGFSLVIAWWLGKFIKRKHEEGAFDLVNFLKLNPAFAIATVALLIAYSGKTFVRNGQWESNLTLFTADIEHLDNSARGQYNYGTGLMQQAQKETDPNLKKEQSAIAIKALSRAVEIYPEYWDAYLNMGMAHEVAGDRPAAAAVYENLLLSKPDYRKGLYNRASVYGFMGNWEASLKGWQAFLAYNPEDGVGLYKAGNCLGRLGRFKEAEPYLVKAVTLNPDLIEARIALAQTYGFQGQNQKVISTLLPSLPGSTNPEVHNTIGIAYMSTGNSTKAIEHFTQCVTLLPNDRTAKLRLADAYQKSGNAAKAQEWQQRANQ